MKESLGDESSKEIARRRACLEPTAAHHKRYCFRGNRTGAGTRTEAGTVVRAAGAGLAGWRRGQLEWSFCDLKLVANLRSFLTRNE